MFWFVIFLVSLMFFFIYHYHYLFLLLGLEFLLLSFFYGISVNLYFVNFLGLLTLLVLLVCMGGFGLSLLVFLVRSMGFDFFLFF